MTASLREFEVGRFSEHLLETGYLLTQRQRYFEDPTISWLGVAEPEERLAAHVDTIELGELLAQRCAVEYLTSGGEDELAGSVHALASIHHGVTDQLDILLEHFAQADDEQLGSYVEALKHATHPQVADVLMQLLGHERAILSAAAAEILGYRRAGDAKRLWPLLRHGEEMVSGAAVIALARLGDRSALPALEQTILDSSNGSRHEWLLPLLLLGSRRALAELTNRCSIAGEATPVGLMCLAMASGRDSFSLFACAVQFSEIKAHVYAALGTLGDLNAIPYLLEGLRASNDAERMEAAKALQQLTGAGLVETVEVEVKEQADLSPEDVTGEPKSDAPTDEPVRTKSVQQVCTQYEPWQQWWAANSKRFADAQRWRHGRPFTLGVCIDDMADPHADFQTRQNAYMELLIRSGQSIPFEPDWFIARQLQAIASWRAWWQGAEPSFVSRPWTFDGY